MPLAKPGARHAAIVAARALSSTVPPLCPRRATQYPLPPLLTMVQLNSSHSFFDGKDNIQEAWRRAKAGERVAQEQLIQSAVRSVQVACRLWRMSSHDREDLSQTVAVALLRRFRTTECPRNFKGMTWGITRSAAGTLWRKKAVHNQVPGIDALYEIEGQLETPWRKASSDEEAEILLASVRSLRAKHQQVIEQRFLNGMSVSAIAIDLQESHTIVYRRIQQASVSLAMDLARRGLEP